MNKVVFILMALLLLALPLVPACDDDDDKTETASTITPTDESPSQPMLDKEFTLKLTHIAPEGTERYAIAEKFAELVKDYTRGRVEIEIYPNAMLYSAITEWDATVTGAADMYLNMCYFSIANVPWFSVLFLIGMWEDEEHADRFVRSPEVNALLDTDVQEKGLKHLGLLHSSIWGVQFNSKHEVKQWKDMGDLRNAQRPASPILHTDAYAGHTPVEVPQAEMFTALSTGVVDEIGVGVSLAHALKIWELGADHAFEVLIGPNALMLETNLDTWNELPVDIQDIITDEVMPELVQFSYDYMQVDYDRVTAALKAELDTWNRVTPEDNAEMWAWAQDHKSVIGIKDIAGQWLVDYIEDIRPSND